MFLFLGNIIFIAMDLIHQSEPSLRFQNAVKMLCFGMYTESIPLFEEELKNDKIIMLH